MTDACELFTYLSHWTHNRLNTAKQLGMAYGEETITEHNLLLLKLNLQQQVKLKSFTRTEESLNGADWEWWIGRHGSWFGMRVQAKRIYYPKQNFPKLYSYKTASAPDTQINILIQRAAAAGITPAYCLYVGDPAPEFSGCQIADAYAVKAVNDKNYSALTPILKPWQNLVCSGVGGSGGSSDPDGNTPDDPAQLAHECLQSSLNSALEISDGFEFKRTSEIREELPDYLLDLRKFGDVEDDRLRKLAIEKRLQGFLVLDEGEWR